MVKNHSQKKSLSIALCDDDAAFIEEFSRQLTVDLNKRNTEFSLDTFSDSQSLVKSDLFYDAIFLDIRMDELSGLEAARILREKNIHCPIVFLTAHKEYVFEAFDVEAFHYLIKPIDPRKLGSVIDRMLKQLSRPTAYLTFKSGDTMHSIALSDIYYMEVMDRKIFVHCASETLEFYGKILHLEEQVQPEFFRCHRSYLVNLSKVIRFDKDSIYLSDNRRVPLSKRKAQMFSTVFFDYIRKDNPLS